MENTKFKVVFEGFETEQQAREFADWYEGSGEQAAGDWLEESCGISANTDMEKYREDGGFLLNENNELIVKLAILHRE